MNPPSDQDIAIGRQRILLPVWLPKHAVDPRIETDYHEYWTMVATGSIALTPEQLDAALQLARTVDQALSQIA